MKKIMLIRPPFLFPKAQKRGNFGTPPLGIAYLSAVLKEKGHQVRCIDAYGEKLLGEEEIPGYPLSISGLNKYEICKRIPEDTDIIGLSCMFSNEWIYTREIVREVKIQFPEALIILGGEHATADPDQCFFDNPEIDLIVTGEGEETICELLDTLERKESLESVRGLIWKQQGVVKRNPARPRIEKVDSIPWPDWSEIPIQNYLDSKVSYGRQGKRAMPLLASRGCPYSCTFCSNALMWGNKWKVRPADDVIREIVTYVDRYQIEHFDFMDLTAIIREDWILEFCQHLIEKNLNLTWALPTGTRSEALTAKALAVLRKSGCIKINYAPESGSPETLKRIKKRVDLDKMLRSMRTAVDLGLICRANIIIGLPGDRWKDLGRTYLFMLKLAWVGLHDLACFGFSPYPGSELHEQLIQSGKIKKREGHFVEQISQSITNAPSSTLSWTDQFSTVQIRFHIWLMMGLFYLLQFTMRPHRIYSIAQRTFSGESLTTLEIVLSNSWRRLQTRLKAFNMNPLQSRDS